MEVRTFAEALWSCDWESVREEDSEQGSVSFSKMNGVTIHIPFGSVTGDYDSSGEPKRGRVDFLYGYTRDNKYLLARNLIVTHWSSSLPGGSERTLSGGSLLVCNRQFDISASIRVVHLYLRGLTDWYRDSPLKVQSQYDTKPFRFKKLEATYDMEDAKSVSLFEGADYRISFEHSFTNPGSVPCTGVTLKHEGFLRIEVVGEKHLDELLSDVIRPLSKFFSLCEGFLADIERIQLYFTGAEISAEYLERGSCSDSAPSDREIQEMPLPYPRIKDRLPKLIGQWLMMSGYMKSGSEIIVSLLTLNWDMPFDMHFLSAAQALEALSRVGQKTEELSDEEYKERVKTICASIDDQELKDWVNQKLKDLNYVGARRLLKTLYDSLAPLSKSWIPRRSLFIDSHMNYRNDFTHRNQEAVQEYAPEAVNMDMRASILLGFAGVLYHLGFSPADIERLMRESNYRSYWIQTLKTYYSKKS